MSKKNKTLGNEIEQVEELKNKRSPYIRFSNKLKIFNSFTAVFSFISTCIFVYNFLTFFGKLYEARNIRDNPSLVVQSS